MFDMFSITPCHTNAIKEPVMRSVNCPKVTTSLLQVILVLCCVVSAQRVEASGYAVFTQGASALGQANAVVAHPTGPSSLYFNPALLNDVPGRQVEFGTTAILSKRDVNLDSTGQTESASDLWNFPSSFYYTHQANQRLTAGIAITFPFGLSNEWDDDSEGRYLGTFAEMFTMNINPAVSFRVNDRLSLAFGIDLLYLDTDQRRMINQTATYLVLSNSLPLPPLEAELSDVEQKFTGDGWGHGFNLGALFKVTDRISVGAAYRSEISVDVEGQLDYNGNDPLLALAFVDGKADTEIKLPAQFVAGVATRLTDKLLVEVGLRWEDWNSTDRMTLELQQPFLGQPTVTIPRDWHSSWAYNLGGQYQANDNLAINLGYLYGENAVPDSTFEPIIPDSDVHLFTVGAERKFGAWTLAGALACEYHDSRHKRNDLGDPIGSAVASSIANQPVVVDTANGKYDSDIYLIGISLGYKF